MTPYEQGFRAKCAELGVEPSALVKRAAGLRGFLGAHVAPKVARFWELLRGSPEAMARHSVVDSALREAQDTIRYVSERVPSDTHASHRNVRNILNLAVSRIKAADPSSTMSTGVFGSDATRALSDLGWYVKSNRAAHRKEMLKVIGARLGLAGGVGGTAYGVGKAVSAYKKEKPRRHR